MQLFHTFELSFMPLFHTFTSPWISHIALHFYTNNVIFSSWRVLSAYFLILSKLGVCFFKWLCLLSMVQRMVLFSTYSQVMEEECLWNTEPLKACSLLDMASSSLIKLCDMISSRLNHKTLFADNKKSLWFGKVWITVWSISWMVLSILMCFLASGCKWKGASYSKQEALNAL